MRRFSVLRSVSGILVQAFSCLILTLPGNVDAELLGDYIGAKIAPNAMKRLLQAGRKHPTPGHLNT